MNTPDEVDFTVEPWRLRQLYSNSSRVQRLMRKVDTAIGIARFGGLKAFRAHLHYKRHTYREERDYQRWIRETERLTDNDRSQIRERIQNMPHKPLLSVLMPVYNVEERWLRRAIESVRSQLYDHWEFCIADDASSAPHIRRVLTEYANLDPRFRVVFREVNGHISAASNTALELATGEFMALMDHDDELAEHALYLVAEELNAHPKSDVIYSDEDMMDERGRRYGAKFKPDWSPDLLRSFNYLNHLSAYRTELIRRIGGFREGFEGGQDYDLAFRASEQVPDSHIRHLPHILYHWRAIPGSVAQDGDAKPYSRERAHLALRDHLFRRGIKAIVEEDSLALHRVLYSIPQDTPLVTIVIASKPRGEFLVQSVQSILDDTSYPNVELFIVPPLDRDGAFHLIAKEIGCDPRVRVLNNATGNRTEALNRAAAEASGSILIFLDGALRIANRNWLRELIAHTLRPEIGVVGGRILDEARPIRTAGIVLGIKKLYGDAHKGFPAYSLGHFVRAQVVQNFSAVSGDCIAVRRDLFEKLSGFDSDHLPSTLFDIDLCLRAGERGFRTVWTPYATLFALDKPDRFGAASCTATEEVEYFRSRWADVIERDPYYNPNLTLEREDFTLAFPPRAPKPWRT